MRRIALGLAGLGLIWALGWSLANLPGYATLPLVVAAAYPLYRFLADRWLLGRRALLAYVAEPQSRSRRWLHRGTFLKAAAYLAAACMMAALALGTGFLEPGKWLAAGFTVIVLGIVLEPLQRRLAGEVRGHHLSLVTAQWPALWLGTAIAIAAFLLLDLVADRPDLRGQPWHDVLEAAYREGADGTVDPLIAVLRGLVRALDAGLSFWAQHVGPLFGGAAAWAFWVAFLTVVGAGTSLLVLHLLACMHLGDRFGAGGEAEHGTTFQVTLGVVVLAITLPYGLGHVLLARAPAERPVLAFTALDPCRLAADGRASLDARLEATAIDETARTAPALERAVAAAFDGLEPHVDSYLDWYFSTRGEYTRLAHALLFDAEKLLHDRMTRIVLEGGEVEARLHASIEPVERASATRLTAAADRYAQDLHAAIAANPCLRSVLPEMGGLALQGEFRHVAGAVAGSGTGLVAAVAVGARLGPSLAGRLGGRTAFRAAAASLGRVAASRGTAAATGAGSGALLCAPTGPAAIACAVGAGIASWFAIDQALLAGEEYLHRETMRGEILEALNEVRDELTDALVAANGERIAATVSAIAEAGDRVYAPAREGVGRPRS